MESESEWRQEAIDALKLAGLDSVPGRSPRNRTTIYDRGRYAGMFTRRVFTSATDAKTRINGDVERLVQLALGER